MEITQEILRKYPSLINLSQEQCDGMEFIIRKVIAENVDEIKSLKENEPKYGNLCVAYKKYIDLLCDELESVVGLARLHGWESSRYDEGTKIRLEIEQALIDLKK